MPPHLVPSAAFALLCLLPGCSGDPGVSAVASPMPVTYVAPEPPRPVFEQVGTASWYGQWHHGKRTANGEIFDMHKLTAAHRTLPLGTEVKVTNLENGRTVEVLVNDRGPYIKGRVIDLSAKAAEVLDMKQEGLAEVKIEVLPADSSTQVAER
jgi:rare lipoprotein A